MPSCISSSKRGAVFYSRVLIAACAILSVGFEIAGHWLLTSHSETYARISQQHEQALQARPAAARDPLPVLIVGNSLLLDGVDVARLQQLTSGQMKVYPIFLEGTGYYDWFYGLQQLFREGSRPRVVVLGIGADSFVSDSVREDYVPLLLFDLQDSLKVASDLKMDRTSTSNLLLAHASVFWDTRSVIRGQILQHVVPGYRDLVSLLKPPLSGPISINFTELANARLQHLRELCEAHGARLILLIPPTPSSADAVRRLTSVSARVGVQTLVPVDPENLSSRYYRADELHLNSEGAALFTSALATVLPRTVVPQSGAN
jgi:hypothetical protein